MSQYRDRAIQEAERAGISPDLYLRLIQQESGWDPTAVSGVGATGLTQVMPGTASDPGYGVTPLRNPKDPNAQLRFGADYLRAMLDEYDGDTDRALAAYNWGPGNANSWDGDMASLPAETRDYIGKVGGGAAPRQAPGGIPAPAAAAEPEVDPYDNKMGRMLGLQEGGLRDRTRTKLGITGKRGDRIGEALGGIGMNMMGM